MNVLDFDGPDFVEGELEPYPYCSECEVFDKHWTKDHERFQPNNKRKKGKDVRG